MKYLTRSVKYFFYLLIILALMIGIIIAAGFAEADPATLFKNGYNSYWQIAIIAAVFAAIYPKLGYSTRKAHVCGETSGVEAVLARVMELHGYRLQKRETGEAGPVFFYVKRSGFSRAVKMWEDTLTCTVTATGIEIEGPTKDLVRIISGLEAAVRPED